MDEMKDNTKYTPDFGRVVYQKLFQISNKNVGLPLGECSCSLLQPINGRQWSFQYFGGDGKRECKISLKPNAKDFVKRTVKCAKYVR